MQNMKQYNLTKDGYFKPIIKKNCDKHYITKQFLINILFPHFSEKKQQKILQKAKKLNIWNIENDIFEPITITFSTCNKECKHYCSDHFYDFGDCYYNQVEFTRTFLKLKLENISDDLKRKDLTHNFYWINVKVLKCLMDYFIILVSQPHSTFGFTDRTPIHLLPIQYYPLKWK